MQRPTSLAILALLLALFTAPTPATAASMKAGLQEELDLKSLVDGSVRWMRAQQDNATGAYGDGVVDTAWALRAFAESPRAYIRQDGPFVEHALEFLGQRQREDGAICDEDAADAKKQTHAAIAALTCYKDPISLKMLERANAFYSGVVVVARKTPLSGEAAEARARELAESRGADGSWTGKDGALMETAKNVIELSHLKAALSHAASAPATAMKLPPFSEANRKDVLASMQRGALFLIAVGDDGRFGAPGRADAGLTSMALSALQCLPAPRPESVQKQIDAGLAWLVSLQKENGAIHDGKLPNYITSASILALVRSEDPRYAKVIQRAQAFLAGLQADEGEGYTEGDLYYGGIGYGDDERPDLSNLQMALDALSTSDTPETAEAFRRAIKFLERSQNRSESNDVRIVDAGGTVVHSGDDGGGAYYPGNSSAGYIELADGTKVPRSYGSMSYALLKGYIFAGVGKDDPRMQAAWKWVCKNYTLDVNPGFEHSKDPMAAYQGLFYYFNTMARALDLFGEEVIQDESGVEHSWRTQLCGRLIAMQNAENGSWINENSPRWWEGNPLLSTAYALLALDSALPAAE